jgi:hypothetical protein
MLDPSMIDPELPEVAMPVLKIIWPEVPDMPALGVTKLTGPLVATGEAPAFKMIFPAVYWEDNPEERVKDPPAPLFPEPTRR